MKKMQPIQWTERPTGGLVAAVSLSPQKEVLDWYLHIQLKLFTVQTQGSSLVFKLESKFFPKYQYLPGARKTKTSY
jgi:hypothetical protein